MIKVPRFMTEYANHKIKLAYDTGTEIDAIIAAENKIKKAIIHYNMGIMTEDEAMRIILETTV